MPLCLLLNLIEVVFKKKKILRFSRTNEKPTQSVIFPFSSEKSPSTATTRCFFLRRVQFSFLLHHRFPSSISRIARLCSQTSSLCAPFSLLIEPEHRRHSFFVPASNLRRRTTLPFTIVLQKNHHIPLGLPVKMSATTFSSICFDTTHCWNTDLRKQQHQHGKPVVKCSSIKSSQATSEKTVRVGVLGASGYTGAEVLRLLANHPQFGVALLTADRKAGQPISSVFPHLGTQDLPDLIAIKDANFSDVDAVLCCLPHGTTQDIIKGLPQHLKIVDLSADFRLRDISEYEEWYGQPHRAPNLQKEATYGLTEVSREEIKNARLVANPGCYPTSVQLPLVPLIKASLIQTSNIIIDAKSGVSGAGRSAKETLLFTEVTEGMNSYGVTRHRHAPEIEQGLTDAARSKVTVSFTPHLIPMSRGMQSTIYVEMAPGVRIDDLYEQLKLSYEDEQFVVILDKGVIPRTHSVKGSNYCLINVFPDRIPGRAIIISVIDNLVKGASGQALQNLNLIMGFPEDLGLNYQPVFP